MEKIIDCTGLRYHFQAKKEDTVHAPNSDAPSSGQALISEQFLGDQFFLFSKKLSVVDIPSSAHKFS